MAKTKDDDQRELMRVTAVIGGRRVDEDIAALAAVACDFDGVNRAICAQTGLFAWWSTLEALAAQAEQDAKDALDALEADLLSSGADATTVTMAKAAMRTDERWKRLHAAWREAGRTTSMVRVGRRTAEERKDMLREVGQNFRAEMQYRLGVRATLGGTPVTDAAEAEVRKLFAKRKGD